MKADQRRKAYAEDEEKLVEALPTPPKGMMWWRKPYTQQFILITADEFKRRHRSKETALSY